MSRNEIELQQYPDRSMCQFSPLEMARDRARFLVLHMQMREVKCNSQYHA